MTKTVIGSFSFGIRKHGVGFVDLLKALFGAAFLSYIGVILFR